MDRLSDSPTAIDVLIIGGGIAGLWTLDALRRAGRSAILVENRALGAGQTIWSQGIIHSGLKYTLAGSMTASAQTVRDMPDLWRACLSGRSQPDLSAAGLRAPCCHLWRTESLSSKVGMIGARVGLRTRPETIADAERPAVLRGCPGTVARLDEPVVDPARVLGALASAWPSEILKVDERGGVEFILRQSGHVESVRLHAGGRTWVLRARVVVLCAGNGNALLRQSAGLDPGRMQVRPLRMVLVRGTPDHLPELNGHCIDGNRTRVTITSATDRAGRRVWQVGGEIAERGASLAPAELLDLARGELAAVLPGFSIQGLEWATYDAPRAEGRTTGGKRPEDVTALTEGNVVTVWPTKLVLAPRAASLAVEQVAAVLAAGGEPSAGWGRSDWPKPAVALAPWDDDRPWTR